MSTSESSAKSLSVASGKARRIWSPAEDAVLKALVGHYGDARGQEGYWKEIAAALHNRTPKDCRKRWFHSLDPSLRKGRWTAQEDDILLAAYAQLGPAWHDIAALIPGRKDDQFSKRYNDILNPLARDRLVDWTPQEDDLLRQGVSTLGHRWSAISTKIPGRPPLTCRNRWRTLSRKSQLRRGASEDTQSSPRSRVSASEQGISPRPQSTTMGPEMSNGGAPNELDLATLPRDLLGDDIQDRDQGNAGLLDPALYDSFSNSAPQTGMELQMANVEPPPASLVLDGVSLSDSSHAASTPRQDWSHLARPSHVSPQLRPVNAMGAWSYLHEPAGCSPINFIDYDTTTPSAAPGQPSSLWPGTSQLSEDSQFWGILEEGLTQNTRAEPPRFVGQPHQIVHVHHHYHYHITKGDSRNTVESSEREVINTEHTLNDTSTYE